MPSLALLGEYQNVWDQATMATPIRARFTGFMTKNGGGRARAPLT